MRKGNLSGVLAAFNNLANPTLRMLGHKNIARHGRAEPSPGRSPWPRAEAPPTVRVAVRPLPVPVCQARPRPADIPAMPSKRLPNHRFVQR